MRGVLSATVSHACSHLEQHHSTSIEAYENTASVVSSERLSIVVAEHTRLEDSNQE